MRLINWTDSTLRQVCEPVEEITDELRSTFEEMCRFLADLRNGAGLSAPQVGIPLRFFVWRRTRGDGRQLRFTNTFGVAVNPELESYGQDESYREGCLTFPNLYRDIIRPRQCRMTYLDPRGRQRSLEVGGFTARVLQHEYDHLDGKLLIDDHEALQAWNELRNKTT